MADQFVISGLARKRADLAGEIEATHERLHQMVQELEHLDATLLLFDPDYQVEGIKPKAFRPPKDWANWGEMSRIICPYSGRPRSRSQPATLPYSYS